MSGEPEKDAPTDRPEAAEHERSFIRRWARRKRRAQASDPSAERPRSEAAGGEPLTCEDRSEAPPPPTDADMPPIESLGEGSDYRGFLSPRVSPSLRRAALRKLFQSPRFNVRDGLDDYDGDYTRYTPLGDKLTAHAKFHAERLRAAADDAPPAVEGEPRAPEARETAAEAPAAGHDPGSGPPAPEDDDA